MKTGEMKRSAKTRLQALHKGNGAQRGSRSEAAARLRPCRRTLPEPSVVAVGRDEVVRDPPLDALVVEGPVLGDILQRRRQLDLQAE